MSGLRTILLFLAATSSLPGALSLTIEKNGIDGVSLTVHGDGLVSGSASPFDTFHYLVFGSADDSFLADGELGKSDLVVTPTISLNGFDASQHLYRDNNGGLGLQSYFEFEFPTSGFPTINLDLSTLNGTYLLDSWSFSDFLPGTYDLVNPTPPPVILSGGGLSEITLEVVPEPSSSLLLFLTAGLLLKRRR